MLLTIKNLAGLKTGHGVALMCSKIISSDLFKLRLLKKGHNGNFLSGIQEWEKTVTALSEKLSGQCLDSSIAESLQRGLEHGSNFKADWIVGNKNMKRRLHEVHDEIAARQPELLTKKDKIVTELKHVVLSAFQETVPQLIHDIDEVSIAERQELLELMAHSYRHLHIIETKHGRLRFLHKHAVSTAAQKYLPQLAKSISRLTDPPAYVKRNSDRETIGRRFKKQLLYFLADKLSLDEPVEVIDKVVAFFKGLFASEAIELYWRKEYDNDEQVISSIWNACLNGFVRLHIVTCPDYSGFIDDSGIWNFDFLELGTGEGIIAKKSYRLSELIYRLFQEAGVSIRLVHHLPFFEFSDGFYGKEYLDLNGVREKLRQSLCAINEYYISVGIEAETDTSESILSNDEFFQAADSAKLEIQKALAPREDFQRFFNETLKKRASIYRRWYPMHNESEKEYELKLRDKLWQQLAEYYTETALLNDGQTIMIFADSPQLSQVYSFFGIPAFCGHGKGTLQYAG